MNIESAQLILVGSGIRIYAMPERLIAYFQNGGFLERTFPEVEDLFTLPFRGLLSRAQEFYNELTKQ